MAHIAHVTVANEDKVAAETILQDLGYTEDDGTVEIQEADFTTQFKVYCLSEDDAELVLTATREAY